MTNRLRELMLLRHAKSDWKDDDIADIDRPLASKGKKNACKLGAWLGSNDLMPDLVLVSPALRAQQTFKRLCNECSVSVITVEELYLAELDQLLKVLAEAPYAERIMLVGHNPGLESLLHYLTSREQEPQTQLFPTCSLAHIILPSDWSSIESGSGHLKQFITPKDIKAVAKSA